MKESYHAASTSQADPLHLALPLAFTTSVSIQWIMFNKILVSDVAGIS